MFRRYFFPVLGTVALIAATSILAAAQSGALRGHVTFKQADGTVVPAVDATVDVFRTDTAGEYVLKTNKKGEFVHVGLAYTGTYTIAASMPGAQPDYLPDVKAGRDADYTLNLTPGDGKRLTRDDIKTLTAAAPTALPTAGTSAEDRAKRAELERQNLEIAASNEKAKNSNTIVDKAFKAGNEALKAKNYDLAISSYDEGLGADADHPGAPSLLTNKTMALNARGVDEYNAYIKATDEATKKASFDAAKKDWTEASKTSARAVALLKAAPSSSDPAQNANTKTNLYYALIARSESMRLYVTKVDQTQADAGVTAFEEFIAAETDPAKKTKAQKDMAQMLFDANAYDKAKPAYEKILAQTPDDAESLKNIGLILYNLGFIKEAEGKKDEAKANYQLAANYLQQFVDKASDGPMKTDAQDILKNMKDQQNVQAEKGSTPTRRRSKP